MEKAERRKQVKLLLAQYRRENANDRLTLESIGGVGGDNACIIVGIILTISPLLFVGIPLLISGVIEKNKKLNLRESINQKIRLRNAKIEILEGILIAEE